MDFTLPSWLNDQDASTIHQRMMEALPAGLDDTEGGFPWDMTMPAALEIAQMAEFTLPEAIKCIWPMWSYGSFLDYHAATRGLARKPAVKAEGAVEVSGTAGTEIPAGFQFSTPAAGDSPGVSFITNVAAMLTGTPVSIPVTAQEAGKAGNVSAGMIQLMDAPMTGIQSVTNSLPTKGGIDDESDEDLSARIVEYDQSQGKSFVGSVADYRRWAMEVNNVGSARVQGAQDESGTIKIIVLDASGDPADTELCTEVYNHIMRPDSPDLRLAEVNAKLQVVPPKTVAVSIEAVIKTDKTVELSNITAAFSVALRIYFRDAGSEVKYTKVGALLLSCAGVLDYDGLLINGGEENVPCAADEMPVAGSLHLTEAKA